MKNLEDKLKKYVFDVYKRIHLRKINLGLIDPQTGFEQEASESFEKILNFIKDNNEMCDIWHSQECHEDRMEEAKFYGRVKVYKVKCIDGRKPRGFEGDADSLKTEEALIALDTVRSTGELIPRQVEICSALADPGVEPLEISLAHYDSKDIHHGCAAIQITLSNPDEDVWNYLNSKEKSLVYSARASGNEISNLVLLELTNVRAFTNFHNRVREEAGVPPLKRVGLVALFDTRTMGMEVREPLIENKKGELKLKDLVKAEVISSTDLAKKLKSDSSRKSIEYGKYKDNFHKKESFKDYSRALVNLTEEFLKSEDKEIRAFIQKHYSDLTVGQQKALIYRFLRSVAHQYLSALADGPEYHPFSGHEEKYGSVSKDADYPGKYILDYQTFRMSCPDDKTAAKRMSIAATVMDATGVDKGKPHIFFISTAIPKEVYKNKDQSAHQTSYQEVINRNMDLFRSLSKDPKIRDRIDQGNILPVGVLVANGEVVDIVEQDPLYL